jgi:hypothetical protein
MVLAPLVDRAPSVPPRRKRRHDPCSANAPVIAPAMISRYWNRADQPIRLAFENYTVTWCERLYGTISDNKG